MGHAAACVGRETGLSAGWGVVFRDTNDVIKMQTRLTAGVQGEGAEMNHVSSMHWGSVNDKTTESVQ